MRLVGGALLDRDHLIERAHDFRSVHHRGEHRLGAVRQYGRLLSRGLDPLQRRLRVLIGIEVEIGRSEEHTSELQSLMRISYAVFCLKKKKTNNIYQTKTIPHSYYLQT